MSQEAVLPPVSILLEAWSADVIARSVYHLQRTHFRGAAASINQGRPPGALRADRIMCQPRPAHQRSVPQRSSATCMRSDTRIPGPDISTIRQYGNLAALYQFEVLLTSVFDGNVFRYFPPKALGRIFFNPLGAESLI